MTYRLGEFRPVPDLVGLALRVHGERPAVARPGTFLARLLSLLAQVEPSPASMLEELLHSGVFAELSAQPGNPRRLMLELERESETLQRAPDLLASPDLGDVDRTWVRELYAELAKPGARRAGLRLFACWRSEKGEGTLAIAGACHQRASEVRSGDAVLAGFAAIRRSGEALRIWQRPYRVLCTNGFLVQAPTGEDALADEESVGAAVAHCLSGAALERAARRLRGAARMLVRDPLALLHELPGEDALGSVLAAWDEGEDRTLFGAMNAVSAVARAEEHFGRRLELERAAGRMLGAYCASHPGAYV